MKSFSPCSQKVAIIGAGVVGTALGYLLKKAGYEIAGIASRTRTSAQKARKFIGQGDVSTDLSAVARKADIVFITTSDTAIEDACRSIASGGGFRQGAFVLHTCGALPSGILRSAKKRGAKTGSLHPLQSLANVKEAVKNLPGSYFCVEGDPEAVAVAKEVVRALKGKEIAIQVTKKPLYHAGACAASNFLVATVGFGLDLFQAAGISRQDSIAALMPLIKGTVRNIESLGIPAALTGPIARGDARVVEDHLCALSKKGKLMTALYTELGKYTVTTGIRKGTLKKEGARALLTLFNAYLS
jgi:predicted short-subunit dehydrogenase-like oxidoreductase (DUF2520 family)